MDSKPASNVLQAAMAFARRSAAIVIAPLATIALAPDATASAPALDLGELSSGGEVFNPNGEIGPTYYSGGTHIPVVVGSVSTTPLGTIGGVNSVHFKVDQLIFTTDAGGPSTQTAWFSFSSPTNGGSVPAGTTLSLDYDFQVIATPGIKDLTWRLGGSIIDSFWTFSFYNLGIVEDTIAYGSGLPVSYSGQLPTPLTAANTFDGGLFSLSLSLSFTADNDTDTVTFAMPLSSQGFTFSATAAAVPEPSTYALLLGVGALWIVILRRSRRTAA